MSAFLREVGDFVSGIDQQVNLDIHGDQAFLKMGNGTAKSIRFASLQAIKKSKLPEASILITEDEWHRNKQAVQSRICSLLKITQRIHGRQCTVKKISKMEAKVFIDQHHIMGYAGSHFHFALFFQDELVAVAAFSKGRPMRRLPADKRSFELVRFCNKSFFTVVGGLSKLISHFIKEQKPGDIITYVDITWAEPAAYYALGFICAEHLPPLDFIINTKTFERITLTNGSENSGSDWISYRNKGNLKLIKTISDEA